MQQTLARRAAKDASPLFPSTSGSSSESDEAFLVAGTPLRPFVSTRGQPGLKGSNIKGLVLFDVASGKERMIRSSPENARDAKAMPFCGGGAGTRCHCKTRLFLFMRSTQASLFCEMTDGRDIVIEVDGGITAETAPLVAAAGARALVAGSAVFKGDGEAAYRANMDAIRAAAS